MDIPGLLSDSIREEEKIVSRVLVASGTNMITTNERVFIHREEGIINNEIFEEYSLDVEQISVFSDKRKARVVLSYGLEGTREFSVYAKYYERVVDPLVRGVIKATGVVEPGELIRHVHRYGQLTIVLTDKQVLKHIGIALWSRDYESYRHEDIARIDIETGGASAEILIEYKGRIHRIKTDKERARRICVQARNCLALYRDCIDYQEYEKKIPSIFDKSAGPIPKISKSKDTIIVANEIGEIETPDMRVILEKIKYLEEIIEANKIETEGRVKEIKSMLENKRI